MKIRMLASVFSMLLRSVFWHNARHKGRGTSQFEFIRNREGANDALRKTVRLDLFLYFFVRFLVWGSYVDRTNPSRFEQRAARVVALGWCQVSKCSTPGHL